MANTARSRVTVEFDGSFFTIFVGNILLCTTNKASDLVAACKGKPVGAAPTSGKKIYREETVEEFLARGGRIKTVTVIPGGGFEFSEKEIETAVAQWRSEITASASAPALPVSEE